MTSPLQPEFFGEQLRIVLPLSVTEITVGSDLYSQWKEWAKIGANIRFPPAFRTIGGDPLTPGIKAGAYYFIRNDLGWRIRPAEEDATVFIEGNLAPEDSAIDIVVPTIGNFRVLLLGLQPITQNVADILTQVQDAAYNGIVAIDPVNGVPGTSFPTGTLSQPVDNLQDAFDISDRLGTSAFSIRGSITMDRDAIGYAFTGLSSTGNDILSMGGFDFANSRFQGLTLTGAMTGNIEAVECEIELLTGMDGKFRRCGMRETITTASNATVTLDSCFSEVSGIAAPIFIIGANNDMSVRNWSGGLEVQNCTTGTFLSLDGDPATFILGPTNTGGQINIRGVADYQNTMGSPCPNVFTKGLLNTRELQIAMASLVGNADVSGDDLTVTIRDEDLAVLRQLSVTLDTRTRRIV